MPLKVPTGRESSWTEDLPLCEFSGLGFQTNLIYTVTGQPKAEHTFEDLYFRFHLFYGKFSHLEQDAFLYGVFDAHDGLGAAEVAAQKIPAELLLGQLLTKNSDDEIKEALAQALISAEREFFESIGDLLALRASLLQKIPPELRTYEATQKYPEEMKQLGAINLRISSGCSAVVALIYKEKLYIANVGDCRALLCYFDAHRKLRVIQLSVDHDVELNADENLRMMQLGLTREQLIHFHHPTRCIGDFPRKGAYQDNDVLCYAKAEPVIADPEVRGGIPIDGSCQFLVLMSAGVWRTFSDATGIVDTVNGEIAGFIAAEFNVQTTLNGVAQAVVDRIARIHHDAFLAYTDRSFQCQKRDDMTLLVRNLHYPLAHAGLEPNSGCATMITCASRDSVMYNSDQSRARLIESDSLAVVATTNYSVDEDGYSASFTQRAIPLDEHGRVAPYVDFSLFYEAKAQAKRVAEKEQQTRNSRTGIVTEPQLYDITNNASMEQ